MKATIDVEFHELQSRIQAAGLFKKSSGFYIVQAATIFTLCAVSVGILICIEGFWLRVVANAIFLAAFASAQGGFLMHEVVHQQVLNASGWHMLVCACLDFFLGSSGQWWQEKHNIGHHLHPNDPEKDSDVEKVALMAFTTEQALVKGGFCRFTTRYQHLLLPFLLLFQPWHMRFAATRWLCKQQPTRTIVGLSVMGLHLIAYGILLLLFLPFWHALAFAFLHNASLGLYFGVAFLVNHTGMEMQPTQRPGYLCTQVLTARNISGGWWTPLITFLMGGLNFQIEHHLFPEMPIKHYRGAAVIVRQFCGEREEKIEYHCVGPWKACVEVFLHFRDIARYAR